MLRSRGDYAQTYDQFQWTIPDRYNIGVDICDRPAALRPDAPAIIDIGPDGQAVTHSFDALRRRSNQLARALTRLTSSGDRIGVLLPQSVETALAHIVATKSGRSAPTCPRCAMSSVPTPARIPYTLIASAPPRPRISTPPPPAPTIPRS